MSRSARPGGDAGSAMVEFTFLAVLLMVPLVYVVLTVFEVQRAAYGVTQATREAGRAFVTADDAVSGAARARLAARLALADQGVRDDAEGLRIDCVAADSPGAVPAAGAGPCLAPGSTVHVALDTEVPLPFLPRIFEGRAPASVGVRGRHVEAVDDYRGGGRP